jgi:hypothetical protein
MAITKGQNTKGAKMPIVLKGAGQALCLEMKIGSLRVEFWDFPNEEAHGYARLIFDQAGDGIDEVTDEEQRKWSVFLPWYACCAVSSAIQDWLAFLESGIEEYREPALHMELESLTFDFYRQTVVQGPKMVCIFENDCCLSRQVILTRSETCLLGRLLFCEGDDQRKNQD